MIFKKNLNKLIAFSLCMFLTLGYFNISVNAVYKENGNFYKGIKNLHLGSEVYANLENGILTISGSGTIEKSKWGAMIANSEDLVVDWKLGNIDINFDCEKDKISFPEDCSFFFFSFHGNITGLENVNMKSTKIVKYMFQDASCNSYFNYNTMFDNIENARDIFLNSDYTKDIEIDLSKYRTEDNSGAVNYAEVINNSKVKSVKFKGEATDNSVSDRYISSNSIFLEEIELYDKNVRLYIENFAGPYIVSRKLNEYDEWEVIKDKNQFDGYKNFPAGYMYKVNLDKNATNINNLNISLSNNIFIEKNAYSNYTNYDNITIMDGSYTLVPNIDYKIYEYNTLYARTLNWASQTPEPTGQQELIIKGIGNYSGTKCLPIYVNSEYNDVQISVDKEISDEDGEKGVELLSVKLKANGTSNDSFSLSWFRITALYNAINLSGVSPNLTVQKGKAYWAYYRDSKNNEVKLALVTPWPDSKNVGDDIIRVNNEEGITKRSNETSNSNKITENKEGTSEYIGNSEPVSTKESSSTIKSSEKSKEKPLDTSTTTDIQITDDIVAAAGNNEENENDINANIADGKLPQTGGFPISFTVTLGSIIGGIGLVLKKKK